MAALPLVNSVLSRHKPPLWDNMTYDKKVLLQEVDISSHEYERVKNMIRKTLSVDVSRVQRVQNPYLYGCYLLKKEEYISRYGYVTEKELFHATSAANVSSITTYNLDWRRSVRTKFGEGVSFSPDAHYANLHCNRVNPKERALLIAKVLIHLTCLGYSTMVLPQSNYDTSIGNGGSVYVKYNDNEFYPDYVAYYSSPPIPTRYGRYGRFF